MNHSMSSLEFLVDHAKPQAKVSVILLDWSVRESFHSLHYLNQQTVDRSQYELIWIEFYDRKPAALLEAVEAAETAGRPLVDKLVVMNYPRDVIFHKHRMYNLGIVLSEGQICVICDSDAMFTPTFIQSIIAAFEMDPQAAVHLDEVRSISRDFYPFNFPTFEKFLASPCINWTGRTTKGLDHSKDMLHDANYGACLAARRDDLIRIGGSDEHLDYLGYICGPYDLTFRLVNAGCREKWLTDEYLYHSWHPGESGINIDYHGPSDGRGVSSRSLAARKSGEIQPGLENGAIRALRTDPQLDRRQALAQLESPDDEEWLEAVRTAADGAPQLVSKSLHGTFDIYCYRGCWYGIPTSDETFDPVKAQAGYYRHYARGQSQDEIVRWARRHRRRSQARRLLNAGTRVAKTVWRSCLGAVGVRLELPFDPTGTDPQIVCLGVRQHNIVYYRGEFFGVPWTEGAFDPARAASESECPYLRGDSTRDVKIKIRKFDSEVRRQRKLQRRHTLLHLSARAAQRTVVLAKIPHSWATRWQVRRRLTDVSMMILPMISWLLMPAIYHWRGRKAYDPHVLSPQIVREGFRGHNIVYYRGEFFGACQSLRAFQPVLARAGQDCPYHRGKSVAEVVRRITEWVEAQPPQPWNWRQVALFRLAARIVRPLIPTPAVDAVRRWRKRHSPLEHRPAIAGIIGANGFETSEFEPGEFESERKAA